MNASSLVLLCGDFYSANCNSQRISFISEVLSPCRNFFSIIEKKVWLSLSIHTLMPMTANLLNLFILLLFLSGCRPWLQEANAAIKIIPCFFSFFQNQVNAWFSKVWILPFIDYACFLVLTREVIFHPCASLIRAKSPNFKT